MSALEIAAFLLVGASGAAVVLNRKPLHQIVALGFLGIALSVLFVVLQAPEVALSQLAVGGALVPTLFLAALAATKRATRSKQA